MKITKLEPNKLVEWECVDSRHPKDSGWSDLRDWVGTKIRFEIDAAGPYSSRLNFVHFGLVPKLECYKSCEIAWAYYLNVSLRDLLEKGKGKPYNDDSEDNISCFMVFF